MRSAEAAKNTARLIEESVKNSQNGVAIAGEVSKVLEQIVGTVAKTTDLVGEIAAASQDQAQGIDQINTAVSQMDKVTQQNAANAEESASASEELSAQAESMTGVIQQMVGLVGGAAAKQQNAGSTSRQKALRTAHVTSHKAHEGTGKNAHALSMSDRVFHKIASKAKDTVQQPQQPARDPEMVIPLNQAEDDFSGFNG
jgi:methyl-accepting chemotaxis protein